MQITHIKYHCISWRSCRYINTYTNCGNFAWVFKGSCADHKLIFQPYLLHPYLNVILLLLTATSLPKLWGSNMWIRSHSVGKFSPRNPKSQVPGKTNTNRRETRSLLDSMIHEDPPQARNSKRRGCKSPWKQCCQYMVLVLLPTEPTGPQNHRKCQGLLWGQRVWGSVSNLPTLRGKHKKKKSAF